jgi:hypothetical protein
LEKSGHSVVAATPKWKRGTRRNARSLEDPMTPQGFVRCAASFEELVYRMWIESSIGFAENAGRPLTPEQTTYADAMRRLSRG